MKARAAVALLMLGGLPVFGHRLDEYLQATLISLESNRLQAEMTLTPGVAVLPQVIAAIDIDADGVISEREQRVYAEVVLSQLSLTVDGRRAMPRLASSQFPTLADMQAGRGEIHFGFVADLPARSGERVVRIENRHQPAISVYLVNSLVPSDPNIRISAQKRNYSQSQYELDYVQTAAPATSIAGWSRERVWLAAIGFLMAASLAVRLWRLSSRSKASQGAGCGTRVPPPVGAD